MNYKSRVQRAIMMELERTVPKMEGGMIDMLGNARGPWFRTIVADNDMPSDVYPDSSVRHFYSLLM